VPPPGGPTSIGEGDGDFNAVFGNFRFTAKVLSRRILRQSNKDSAADMGFFDAREFTVEATERGRETLVVDAQNVEHRGVERRQQQT
jgi:hypothetical protein